MIRFWRFLVVGNFTISFLLAWKGDAYYAIPLITAAYCNYQLYNAKNKETHND